MSQSTEFTATDFLAAEFTGTAEYDPLDVQQVPKLTGLLGVANRAGLLYAADVHVTRRLAALAGEEVSDPALLATALAVRAVRLGSTCLALRDVADLLAGEEVPPLEVLMSEVNSCPLVVGARGGPLTPLVLVDSADGPLLYLRKYFQQEQIIRDTLRERTAIPLAVDPTLVESICRELLGEGLNKRQKLAVLTAASRSTTILTGGPGTGKTHTVASILAVLDEAATRSGKPGLKVAVCAPTGRAVAQIQASLDRWEPAGAQQTSESASRAGSVVRSAHAVTLHKLLGWYPGTMPRYGRSNKLPHDVVVVDETSMLAMTSMSHLLEALRPQTRLILVGDPHQLASVEAGAVLADLVEREPSGQRPDAAFAEYTAGMSDDEQARLADGIVTLTDGFRNEGGIADIAALINSGDGAAAAQLLARGQAAGVSLVDADAAAIRERITTWGLELRAAASKGRQGEALEILDRHRVLCAHREGRYGVRGWTRDIMEWLSGSDGHPPVYLGGPAGPGQPVLVTASVPTENVFTGDCGVAVSTTRDGEGASDVAAEAPTVDIAFRRSSASPSFVVSPARLPDTLPAYAMTIHRSQGSQFTGVTVVLPPPEAQLLTRELLYTAITRAVESVQIVGTPEMLIAATNRRVQRASGLRSEVVPRHE